MKKINFKKVTSLLMAAVMCVTTFASIGATTAFAAETGEKAEVYESEKMKSNRKKRFVFQPDEIKVIRSCLLDWRNEQIRAEKETAVEVINELIVKFI